MRGILNKIWFFGSKKQRVSDPGYTPIWLWEEDWEVGDDVAKFRLRLNDGATETVTFDFNDGNGPYTLTDLTQTITAAWSVNGTYAVEMETDSPTGFMNLEYVRKYNNNVADRCDITAALDRFAGFFLSINNASFHGSYLRMVNSSDSAFCNFFNYILLDEEDIDINTVEVTCTTFVQHTMVPDAAAPHVYTGDLSTYLPKIQGAGLTTIQLYGGNHFSFDSIVNTLTPPTTVFNLSSNSMTAASVDNCLISCRDSGFTGCIINLAGNDGRTAASDAAVADLITAGNTIYT